MKHKLRKGLTVGVICLLILVSVPNISSYDKTLEPVNTEGLIDNIDIYCRGPYLFQIIIRECVFTVSFLNENNVPIDLKLCVNVTTRDGTLLFIEGAPFYYYGLPPNHEGNMQYQTFRDFRKAGHLFGFFDINVYFRVRNDGSERKEVFHGFIFGISAVILNPEGEVIE